MWVHFGVCCASVCCATLNKRMGRGQIHCDVTISKKHLNYLSLLYLNTGF